MTIPNLITMLRLCLVPAIVACVAIDAWQAAFWLFLAAGISDGIDGFIAKHFDQRSELGAVLDPLADKTLLVSLYVALGVVLALPAWLVVLVVVRDLMIVGVVLGSRLAGSPLAVSASALSKCNTAAQIVLVQVVLFSRGFAVPLPTMLFVGTIAVAALTLASGAAYLRVWLDHLMSSGKAAR